MGKNQELIYRYFKYRDSLNGTNIGDELIESINRGGYKEAFCENIINRGKPLDATSKEELELKLAIVGF